MIEEWRAIPEYPLYEASSLGRIRSWAVRGHLGMRARKPTMLAISTQASGHHRAHLGRTHGNVGVHVLVALAFIGPKGDAEVCRHLDGNPANNVPSNLAWSTQAENMADKERHGTAQKGVRHPRAKLTDDDVRFIRASSASSRSLGFRFRISRSAIQRIRHGKGWTHVA